PRRHAGGRRGLAARDRVQPIDAAWHGEGAEPAGGRGAASAIRARPYARRPGRADRFPRGGRQRDRPALQGATLMALGNVGSREIHCKIVYYGPGFGGKTTNVVQIHGIAPAEAKGELLSIATETERTLFFDFLPLDLGEVEGYKVRFHVYTVPGQPLYERTR